MYPDSRTYRTSQTAPPVDQFAGLPQMGHNAPLPNPVPAQPLPQQLPFFETGVPTADATFFGTDKITEQKTAAYGGFEDEPPLLEELGINFEHIWQKTLFVLLPRNGSSRQFIEDTDLAGPLLYCTLLGFSLLLSGKIHFGYIYGFGVFACVAVYCLLNLLSGSIIELYRTVSILGYCLLPICLLSMVHVVLDLRGYVGLAITALVVSWCTLTSSRLFDMILESREQRWLIAYPLFLVYACFALLTVF